MRCWEYINLDVGGLYDSIETQGAPVQCAKPAGGDNTRQGKRSYEQVWPIIEPERTISIPNLKITNFRGKSHDLFWFRIFSNVISDSTLNEKVKEIYWTEFSTFDVEGAPPVMES